MPLNPFAELQRLFSEGLGNSVTQVQHFVFRKQQETHTKGSDSTPAPSSANKAASTEVTKENLGRSTWTLLHTVAAQYPQKPTKRQKKDVEALIDSLARIYPCAQCSQHFQDILRERPPRTGCDAELQQWMCEVHNLVNVNIDKPEFNCKYVGSRWKACDESPEGACALPSTRTKHA